MELNENCELFPEYLEEKLDQRYQTCDNEGHKMTEENFCYHCYRTIKLPVFYESYDHLPWYDRPLDAAWQMEQTEELQAHQKTIDRMRGITSLKLELEETLESLL